jgi:type IV pilus assembly protein PilC
MIFVYKATDQTGVPKEGVIEAINIDVAISSLQRRGFVIASINPQEDKKGLLGKDFTLFERVNNKDIVILSRQMSTLFSAQISALQIFRLLAAETPSKFLARTLNLVADEIQGGSSISKAMAKHPKAFSAFYVNMVRSGEESGKLDEILLYLADYLDRQYEVTSKAKNALIYPAFVIFVFVTVMVLMLTMVIPNIAKIITESGQEVPAYTQVVLSASDFLVHYGFYFLGALIVAVFFLIRFGRTPEGAMAYSRLRITIPYIGNLYRKLYLSRIADNMNTMLVSAIPIVKALEITSSVVGSKVYEDLLDKSVANVRAGSTLSVSLSKYPEIPGLMVQMIRVGEESGELGNILKNLSTFYSREVKNAVDTLVGLIEPIMIVVLGVGVAGLLASVLIPIYNISAGA